jgi:hypothetical protein
MIEPRVSGRTIGRASLVARTVGTPAYIANTIRTVWSCIFPIVRGQGRSADGTRSPMMIFSLRCGVDITGAITACRSMIRVSLGEGLSFLATKGTSLKTPPYLEPDGCRFLPIFSTGQCDFFSRAYWIANEVCSMVGPLLRREACEQDLV